jgi:predicted N-formylglutamate amidohydrolase
VSVEDSIEKAVEVLGTRSASGLVLSGEHASSAAPEGWAWPDEDLWLQGTHWAIDLGVDTILRALARELDAPAVFCRFTRLLIDTNRVLGSPSLILKEAEGRRITMNDSLTEEERKRRVHLLYQPFHDRLDAVVGAFHGAAILSVHSFTPQLEGRAPRAMEIGVLFDRDEEPARRLAKRLSMRGWKVEINEPYSGRNGLMYSGHHHATQHGRLALELEIRQDVATNPVRRDKLIADLVEELPRCGLYDP